MDKYLMVYSQVADFYNKNEFSGLSSLLAEDAIYESQWVLSSLNGKKDIQEHLYGKSQAIRKNGTKVFARLAQLKYRPDRPCIVLSQHSIDNVIAILLMKVNEEGRISRMDICIPDLYLYGLIE